MIAVILLTLVTLAVTALWLTELCKRVLLQEHNKKLAKRYRRDAAANYELQRQVQVQRLAGALEAQERAAERVVN